MRQKSEFNKHLSSIMIGYPTRFYTTSETLSSGKQIIGETLSSGKHIIGENT